MTASLLPADRLEDLYTHDLLDWETCLSMVPQIDAETAFQVIVERAFIRTYADHTDMYELAYRVARVRTDVASLLCTLAASMEEEVIRANALSVAALSPTYSY